ncbi:kunitz-type protease inhibitor 2 [Drosophila obscura]|uniref:kunitz-type protease inhibitor 2 n=1 Tax=Drosophila obscura TaxID=7282 RepID=UPI001BB1848D|nr:kunitz-type protease inhibitor 2 [Drosophila obscura]
MLPTREPINVNYKYQRPDLQSFSGFREDLNMLWLHLALVFLAFWLLYVDPIESEAFDLQDQMAEILLEERKEICLIPRTSYGNCKGKRRMWHYDARRNKCRTFIYSNCGGNQNRFYTHKECMEFCGNYNLKRFLDN